MIYRLLILSVPFLLTSTVSAQEGLISCEGFDCNFCTFGVLINQIINWLFGFMTVVAVIILAVAGFKLVVSGGDTSARDWAKDRIRDVIIGFLIMLSSWLIVDTVLRGLTGSDKGMQVWGSFDIENCGGQVRAQVAASNSVDTSIDAEFEDLQAIAATNPGTYGLGLGSSCNPGTPNFPSCATAIRTNDNMNPIFDCSSGCSSMVRDGAAARMQETLNGPFARLQQSFGGQLVINDALAKAGTSRESNTPDSRHFYGDALDVSLAGMSDNDRIRLVLDARSAGFTGFGLGNNILHIDRGAPRAWAYGNATYGGQSVGGLISELTR